MATRATEIAKNLALAMVFTGAVMGGIGLLNHTFLSVYFAWIVTVGFQVLLFALVLAILALMFVFAVAALNSFIVMVKAIFRRNKNDDQ